MKYRMEIEQYTNFRELLAAIDPKVWPWFIGGAVYGGLIGTAAWHRAWWVLVLIVVLPLALIFVGALLPLGLNPTYRIFFLGVVTVACLGLSYYLAR